MLMIQAKQVSGKCAVLGIYTKSQPGAIFSAGYRFSHYIQTFIFTIKDYFAESYIWRIRHHFSGKIVKHIISYGCFIEPGTV